jgi:2-polyprenyl-6-methoxyphenol hydroxylase-like FAD-dependent oxidoreductase
MLRSMLNIAIVGGSIAGCLAALELARGGHSVHVFERESSPLSGAGIGVVPGTLQLLLRREWVSADLPRLEIRQHAFTTHVSGGPALGHCTWTLPQHGFAVHWADLQRSLRSRVPAAAYHAGVAVSGVMGQSASGATLAFADGSTRDFDLVLFADGYRSRGRAFVCPEAQLEYRGYMLWRAVVPLPPGAEIAALDGTVHLLSQRGLHGYLVAYAIPDGSGRAATDARVVNLACYLPLTAAELADFLIDREGRARAGSLPPGSMRPELEARLKREVAVRVPAYFAALIEQARDTFAQPIFSAAVPRYCSGRLGLLGDAGSLAQPLTGSGVLKAVENARGLAMRLRTIADVDEALAAWSSEATAMGALLVRLGQQMEHALVWNMPDLTTMAVSEIERWWAGTTRLD